MNGEETFGKITHRRTFPFLLVGICLLGIATIVAGFSAFKEVKDITPIYNPAFSGVTIREKPLIVDLQPQSTEVSASSQIILTVSLYNPLEFDVVKDLLLWRSYSSFDAVTKTWSQFSDWVLVIRIENVIVHPNDTVGFSVPVSLEADGKRLYIFKAETAPPTVYNDYYPTSGTDTTGPTYSLTASDLAKLNASDDGRYQTQSGWDNTYKDNRYVELVFTPNVSPALTITNTRITFEWQSPIGIKQARVLVWDQTAGVWQARDLTPTGGVDRVETLDTSGFINTVEDVNNLKIRFQAADKGYKTLHDLVKLTVSSPT